MNPLEPVMIAPEPMESQLEPVLRFMRLLWGLEHSLNSASKRMELRLGITGTQRLVLRVVGQFPGIAAGEVAMLLHLHPSTLTGVLQRLQAKHVVRRLSDASDRRRARFELTKAGARICDERSGTVEEAVERALQRIDPGSIAGLEQLVSGIADEMRAQEDRARAAIEGVVKRPSRRTRSPRSR